VKGIFGLKLLSIMALKVHCLELRARMGPQKDLSLTRYDQEET